MSEELYTTHLLRTEESILHVRARRAIGKQNYIRVAPREVYEVTTALDKARLEIERLREALRWIPVSERLPEPDVFVQVWLVDQYSLVLAFSPPISWETVGGMAYQFDAVTHWRPYAPPEQAA